MKQIYLYAVAFCMMVAMGLKGNAQVTVPYSTDFTDITAYNAVEGSSSWTISTGMKQANIWASSWDCDDWIFTPAIQLTAGKNYRLELGVKSSSSTSDANFEVKIGAAADVASMTTTIISDGTVTGTAYYDVTNECFTVSADGAYVIGIHCTTLKGGPAFYVNKILVEGAASADTPAAVNDLTVTAGAKGALTANIKFTMPAQNTAGAALSTSSDVTATLLRDGVEIKTFTQAPGSSVNYDDVVAAHKSYTYTVKVSYKGEVGKNATATQYIGCDVPGRPSSFKAADNGSSITFSWAAVTAGANPSKGWYFDASDVTYDVYTAETEDDGWNTYATKGTKLNTEPITGTSFNYTCPSGEQKVESYIVVAVNTAGESDLSGAQDLIIGTPYAMPFTESFKSGAFTYYWETDLQSGLMKTTFEAPASDGDGYALKVKGYASSASYAVGKPYYAKFTSGKIDLTDAVAPQLTFDVKGDASPTITVYAITNDNTKTKIGQFTAGTDYAKQTVSLEDFADKAWVRILLEANIITAADANYLYIDNIKVAEPAAEFDLTVSDKGWASMYLGYPVEIPTGVNVYYASKSEGSTITLTEIEEVIPAGTGVLVKATAGTYTFTETEPITAGYQNLLKGVTEETALTDIYVLSGDKTTADSPVFQLLDSSVKLGANKAYIEKSAIEAGVGNALTFDFGTTAINSVKSDAQNNAAFNLNGQAVSNGYKGIVIKNGKKVFVK